MSPSSTSWTSAWVNRQVHDVAPVDDQAERPGGVHRLDGLLRPGCRWPPAGPAPASRPSTAATWSTSSVSGGQPGQPVAQHVAHRGRHRGAVQVQVLGADHPAGQLDHEERVAAGAVVHRLGQAPVARRPQLGGQQRGTSVGSRPPSTSRLALASRLIRVRHRLTAPGRSSPTVRTVTTSSTGARRCRASSPSSCDRGGVGALQVVQDDEHRLSSAASAEPAAEVLEELEAGGVGVVGGGRVQGGLARAAPAPGPTATAPAPRPRRRSGSRRPPSPVPGPGRRPPRPAGSCRCRPRPPARRSAVRPAATSSAAADSWASSSRRPTSSDRGGAGPARPAAGSSGCGSRCEQPRVLGEHGPFQVAQLGAGVDAQLLAQQLGAPPAGVQRLGLPVGLVERGDQPGPQPFPQRVLRDQPLQVGDRGLRAAQGQQRVAAPLLRPDVQLDDPQPLGRRRRVRRPARPAARPATGPSPGRAARPRAGPRRR